MYRPEAEPYKRGFRGALAQLMVITAGKVTWVRLTTRLASFVDSAKR